MLQNSKLSSRFKKDKLKENSLKKLPEKFVLAKTLEKNAVKTEIAPEINADDSYENIQPEISDLFDEDVLKQALLEKIDSIPVWFEYTPQKQKDLIKSFVENKLSVENVFLEQVQKEALIDKLFTSIMGFGPLDYLIAQNNVDAVFVNGTKSVYIEIAGKVLNTEMSLNDMQMNFIINNISNMSGVSIDESKSIWNVKVNNLYITVITPAFSQCGFNISIRKILPCSIDSLIERNMMSKEIFDFLVSVIDSKKNIVISGDINSGKTTLLDTLINTALLNKRAAIFENQPELSVCSDTFMKFSADRKNDDFQVLVSNVLKMMPEYIIADFNSPVPEISEANGVIFTLRASSLESALTKLVSGFLRYDNSSEKYAKLKVYTDYDYIVQINRCNDGVKRIISIVELKPARTSALSVKVIAKFVDGSYISEIPQPLTSIRAESLISQAGSMSARFVEQKQV